MWTLFFKIYFSNSHECSRRKRKPVESSEQTTLCVCVCVGGGGGGGGGRHLTEYISDLSDILGRV